MNGYNRGYGRNRQMRGRPQQNNRQNAADELASKAGAALGASPEEVKNAAQSGDLRSIMSKLSPQQTEQLQKILSDEAAAKKLLATPQAQALLKSLRRNE